MYTMVGIPGLKGEVYARFSLSGPTVEEGLCLF